MVLFINNQRKDIEGEPSIDILLNFLNLESTRGVALAVNDRVVPRSEWENFQVQDQDKITIIRATQGG